VRSIRKGRIDLDALRRTTEALHNEFRRSALQEGDVLLAVRGSFDRAAVVPPQLDGANVSRDVARIAPLPTLDAQFLSYFLVSIPARNFFQRCARGVAVRGVNIGDLRKLETPLPPIEEQRRISAGLDRDLSVVESVERAIDATAARSVALKRSILERAFTGRVVPQDPSDEPASVLVERIRAERAAAGTPARRGRKRASGASS
jgi:type I restriction enzyme S subunit